MRKEFAHLKADDDNVPLIFCIPIDAVVNTNLAGLDEIKAAGEVTLLTISEIEAKPAAAKA